MSTPRSSRRGSRTSSQESRSSSIVPEDEDFIVGAITAVHKAAKEFVLVQNPQDLKMRALNFGSPSYWNQFRVNGNHQLKETGLVKGDKIAVYFSTTERSKQGFYPAMVLGVYPTQATCYAAKDVFSGAKKKPAENASGSERVKKLRRVADMQNSEPGTSQQPGSLVGNDSMQLMETQNEQEHEPSATATPQPAVVAPKDLPPLEDRATASASKTASNKGVAEIGYKHQRTRSDPDDVAPRGSANQHKLQQIVRSFYWKKETPNSLQLRPGYDVWIKRPVLKDLVDHYGPDAVCPSGWYKYGWKLILHMLGGEDNVVTIRSLQKRIGVDAILHEAPILATIGHVTEIFELKEPINKSYFKQKMNNNMKSVVSRFHDNSGESEESDG